MNRVVLRALVLRGFGRFSQVTARFGPGVCVLVRPNEWGKSTLVAGLESVWFGFRYVAAEGGRKTWLGGSERYRCWYGEPFFDGVAVFESGGQLFQLYREFESSRVVLRSRPADGTLPEDALQPPGATRGRGSGGWSQHFRGVHRPGGSRTAEPFEQVLARVLGIPSAELFEGTFCITQRLPEAHQIDAAVQELITGAGTAGLETARRWLVERAKSLTTQTHQLGLTPRPGRTPQRQEQLKVRIEELERQLQQARERLDAHAPVKQELAQVEAELRELRESGRRHGRLLEAWKEWLEHRRRRDEQLHRQAQLRSALRQALELELRIASARERLEREFDDVRQAGPQARERLQQLAAQRVELERLEGELAQTAEREQELEQEAARLRERMAAEFQDLAGRNDLAELPARHEFLCRRWEEWRGLQAREQELGAQQEQLRRSLGPLAAWAARGSRPALEIPHRREQAGWLAKRWERLQSLYAEREATRLRLLSDYACFEEASPEVLEAVRHYQLRRETLREQVRSVRAESERIHWLLAQLQQDRAALEKAYADVREVERRLGARAGMDAVSFLEQCQLWAARSGRLATASRRLRAWGESALPRLRLAGRVQTAAWALAGAAAALLVAFALGVGPGAGAGPRAWAVPGAAAMVVGVLLGAGGARRARRRAGRVAQALAGLKADGERTARGPWAADPGGLVALVERARWYQREREQLARREKELQAGGVSDTALAQLRRRLQALEGSLEELENRVEPFRRRFGDGMAGAMAGWEALRARLAAVDREIAELLRELGVGPDEGDAEPVRVAELADVASVPVPASLEGLAEWMRLAARSLNWESGALPLGTLGELGDLVRRLGDGFWQRVELSAREFEQIAHRLQEVEGELARLHQPDGTGATVLQRLWQEVEQLRQLTAPYDERADPQQLSARVAACQQLLERLHDLDLELQSLRQARQRQQAELSERHDLTARWRQELSALLEAAGGDLEKARERIEEFERLRSAWQQDGEKLRGILEGHGVQSVAELEARQVSVERLIRHEEEAMAALRAQFPVLPNPDDVPGAAVLQQEYERLKEQVKQMEQEVAAADERRQSLVRRQAYLEGGPYLNVAAAELELCRLREELRRTEEEAQAVGEAYRALEQAAADYHREFRLQMEEVASTYFSRFSRRPGRRVILEPDFRIRVSDPDGQSYAPTWLSQGARDQLFIALRLAVAAMVDRQVRLPFVFDDPFLNCDSERLAAIRAVIDTLAADFQVLLFTHRPEFASWGQPVEVQEAAGQPPRGDPPA